MEIVFNNPFYLWFLVAIPLLVISHIFTLKYAKKRALKFANFEAIEAVTKRYGIGAPYRGSLKNANLPLLFARTFTLVCLILAASGAVLWYIGETSESDYVLAVDVSSSMLADDFEPNRMEAAKEAAIDFVDSTPKKSKIGIVSFSGTSFVEKELDTNKEDSKEKLKSLNVKKIGGTDIGGAIVTSSNLFGENSDAKTIVLLTDGQANIGLLPQDAAFYANEKRVTVFAIGVGTEEGGAFEGTELLSKLDENTLKNIANQTNGAYYKVSGKDELKQAYAQIAASKRRSLSVDLSFYFLLAALGLLFIEWALVNARYRVIP